MEHICPHQLICSRHYAFYREERNWVGTESELERRTSDIRVPILFCGLHEEKREYEQEMGILPTLSLGLPPYAEPPAQEAGPPADLFLQSFRPITYWTLSLILLALSGNSSLLLLLIMLKAKD